MDDLGGLLARGGWELDDAQTRHRAHPDTFWLPSKEQLAGLRPGCTARLIFRLVDQTDPLLDDRAPYDEHGHPQLTPAHERMWLWIEERDGDEFVGILQNQPFASHTALTIGSRVRFAARDVIDLDCDTPVTMEEDLAEMRAAGRPVLGLEQALEPVDARRLRRLDPEQHRVCAAAGVLPELPPPMSAALAMPSVFEPDAWPLYGGRFPRNRERNDCGWALHTRYADFDDAVREEQAEITHCLHLAGTRAWPFLALPPGWAFVLGPDGSEDVYQDPSLLE